MPKTSSHYFIILKLANPTSGALEAGLHLEDLLEAADMYNSRFKGLKQMMILRTEGVRVHVFLSMTELTGVTIKRIGHDFSTHLSVFNNYLLNQKKWTAYTQDYRRLLQVAKDPQLFNDAEMLELLLMIGYREDLADQAATRLPFVGPSEKAELKWLLHVRFCLRNAPHLAFAGDAPPVSPIALDTPPLSESARPVNVPATASTATSAPTEAQIPESATADRQVESIPVEVQPVVILPKTRTYAAPPHLIRKHYQQTSTEVKSGPPVDSFGNLLDHIDEPLKPLREQSEREYRQSRATSGTQPDMDPSSPAHDRDAEVVAVLTAEAASVMGSGGEVGLIDSLDAGDTLRDDLADATEMPLTADVIFDSDSDSGTDSGSSSGTSVQSVESAPPEINDEQLMAILHGMVLTQYLGDEQSVANKQATIAKIKALITPWATYGG